ncbi:MAG: GAF domain-containing protein [Candidatus Nanopelagicales bacterium]
MSPNGDQAERAGSYTYRRAWGPQARMDARARLQQVMDEDLDLFGMVEAAARLVCELMTARTVTVTILEGDTYRDLAKVGDLTPGERIVSSASYPVAHYPEATKRLLAQESYVSTEEQREFEQEHLQIVPPTLVSCFMGVPIVADGAVKGELFVTRPSGKPQFTPDDVEVASALGTQFGVRLSTLLAEKYATDPSW